MFTGISEEVGKVRAFNQKGDHVEIGVSCKKVLEGTKIGDSIMTDGVCLTVTKLGEDFFTADMMAESLKVTKFDKNILGKRVNLERALQVSDRLDGHLVQGHVDGVGKIIAINKNVVRIKTGRDLSKYLVRKGSVALDGISLTISYEEGDVFEVSLIPETLEATNFKEKRVGDTLNIETDIIGRFIEKLMKNEEGRDLKTLLEGGF